MEDREGRIGWWVSGSAHGALILWAILGGVFFRPQPSTPLRTTQVATISGAEFEALAAASRGAGPVGRDATAVATLPTPAQENDGGQRPADASAPDAESAAQELAGPDPSEDRPDLSDFERPDPVAVATDLGAPAQNEVADDEAPDRPAATVAPVADNQPARPDAPASDPVASPAPRSELALSTSAQPRQRPEGLVERRNARLAQQEAERRAAAEAARQAAAQAEAAAAAAAEERRLTAEREAAEEARRAERAAAEEAERQAEAEREVEAEAERQAAERREAQERRETAERSERAAEEQRAAEARAAEERRAAEARAAEEAEREREAEERRAEERRAEERRQAEREAEARAEEERRAEAEARAEEERRAAAEREAEEERRAAAEREAEERRAAEAEARAAEERRAAAEREAAEREAAEQAAADAARRQALEDALRAAEQADAGAGGTDTASTGDSVGGNSQMIEGGSGASAAQDPLAAALAGAMSGGGSSEGADTTQGGLVEPMQLAPSAIRPTPLNGIDMSSLSAAPPLSLAEKDAFRDAISRCWNEGALSVEGQQMSISVAFSMTADGRPIESSLRIDDQQGGSDTGAGQAFDVARRAIMMCGGAGFPLPFDKYSRWRDVVVEFRPDGIGVD